MKKIKRYKIAPTNSTVLGDPGTHFDWSNFDWEGKTSCDFGDMRYSEESEYIPQEQRGQLIGVKKAPLPFVDGNAGTYYQYLHVPWKWSEDGCIYRVRPHFEVGQKRWGYKVTKVSAVKEDGVWYWEVELTK